MSFEMIKEIMGFASPILLLLLGAYTFVYKQRATVQVDNETFLRSQILTKDDWQKLADKKDREHADEITRINQSFEEKMRGILQLHQFERDADKREIRNLTKTVEDLQRQITANKP